MKCPKCGDETKQRDWGEIKQKQSAVKITASVLWRCGACAFLYTVPPLPSDNARNPQLFHGQRT